MGNILSFLAKMLAIAPAVVQSINVIHAEKDTATKTQMAQDALGVSSEIASMVIPQFQQHIAVANDMISGVIAGLQKLHAIPPPKPADTPKFTVLP